MASQSANKTLHQARTNKKDEFYTQLVDIEKELGHYREQFQGKVVLCNCDDPYESNFVNYFSKNFEYMGLKKLVATHYKEANMFTQEPPYKMEYTGFRKGEREPQREDFTTKLIGNGDFRSHECIELLEEADIVVTNPPFSLFREYVAQLMKYEKKFLIIGNKNAITYKEIFKLIKDNKLWAGYTPMGTDMLFDVPEAFVQYLVTNKREGSGYKIVDGVVKGRAQAIWFTNLDTAKHHEKLTLYKAYSPEAYPKYDNYDAIEVPKVLDIPVDYDGAMGVPITFLDKYNPEQFEIVRFRKGRDGKDLTVNGRSPYFRIVIRTRRTEHGN